LISEWVSSFKIIEKVIEIIVKIFQGKKVILIKKHYPHSIMQPFKTSSNWLVEYKLQQTIIIVTLFGSTIKQWCNVNNLLIAKGSILYLTVCVLLCRVILEFPFWKNDEQNSSDVVLWNCDRLACENAMYSVVSDEIDSFQQTHLLFWFRDLQYNLYASTVNVLPKLWFMMLIQAYIVCNVYMIFTKVWNLDILPSLLKI